MSWYHMWKSRFLSQSEGYLVYLNTKTQHVYIASIADFFYYYYHKTSYVKRGHDARYMPFNLPPVHPIVACLEVHNVLFFCTSCQHVRCYSIVFNTFLATNLLLH